MGHWKCLCEIDGFYTKKLLCEPLDCENTNLAVKAQKQKHDEEKDGPEGWQRHHGHSFGVGNEGQARTWRGNKERMGGEGAGDRINISI